MERLKLKRLYILGLLGMILIPFFAAPRQVEAITRINGNLSLATSFASGPAGDPSALGGGVNLEIVPPTRKFRTRFNIPLTFAVTSDEKTTRLAPDGIWGSDITGEWYNLNLQYGRLASVSNAAQLTETTMSRAALSVMIPDTPQLFTSLSSTESTTAGITSQADSLAVSSNYSYKWANFRGGFSRSETSSGNSPSQVFYNVRFGMGGSYAVLPRTTLSGDYDLSRDTAGDKSNITHNITLGVDNRPFDWLGIGASLSRVVNEEDSGTSDVRQSAGFSAAMILPGRVKITPSVGTRTFEDIGTKRTVDYATIAASFDDQLRENIGLGLRAARSYESDPSQGSNISDQAGVSLVTDLTPAVGLRGSLNMTRNENKAFVSSHRFDASGTLVERDALDLSRGGLPAGFVFFDTVNNDLYTKNSPATGDWSLPVRFVPETVQYSFSKTIMLTMIPSEKTTAVINYSSSSSSDKFDLIETGSQSISGSLTYTPNRRLSCSIAGNAFLPEAVNASYSATTTVMYRFLRGPQVNMSYSWQSSANTSNSLSGNIGIPFRKRVSLGISYSFTQLFTEEQTYLIRVGLTKSF